MSSRSDVAIALKSEFTEKFEALLSERKWEADETVQLKGGVGKIYQYSDVRWCDLDPDVDAIETFLQECGAENYSMVEACHDYPSSDENDRGDWTDPSFHLGKNVSVSLSLTYEDDEG
jgi:hypothetical protein